MIVGNHDTKTLKYPGALEYFESVDKMMHVNDNGSQICLCHFPIAEWNAYNAATCINNYVLSTLDDIIANNQKFVEENPLSWRDINDTQT